MLHIFTSLKDRC